MAKKSDKAKKSTPRKPRCIDILGASVRSLSPRSAVITKGDVTNRQLPTSGIINVGTQTKKTLVYKGTLAALTVVIPARGDTVTGETGYIVETAVLSPANGDLAELTVNMVLLGTDETELVFPEVVSDKYDIDWMRIEKPIETSTFLGDSADQAAAAIVLDLWTNTEPKLRAQYIYVDEDDVQSSLVGNTLEIAKKIMKGVTSYLEFVPVVQRVRIYQGRPITGGCGLIEDPPANAITGYVFLKTADRLNDQEEGVSVRTEEWTGAIEWDTDLYDTAGV